jgi:hypothetical protein
MENIGAEEIKKASFFRDFLFKTPFEVGRKMNPYYRFFES